MGWKAETMQMSVGLLGFLNRVIKWTNGVTIFMNPQKCRSGYLSDFVPYPRTLRLFPITVNENKTFIITGLLHQRENPPRITRTFTHFLKLSMWFCHISTHVLTIICCYTFQLRALRTLLRCMLQISSPVVSKFLCSSGSHWGPDDGTHKQTRNVGFW